MVFVTPRPVVGESQKVLIKASKLKPYVEDKFDMNTWASLNDSLAGNVRRMTDEAAKAQISKVRKTIMDKDFLQ